MKLKNTEKGSWVEAVLNLNEHRLSFEPALIAITEYWLYMDESVFINNYSIICRFNRRNLSRVILSSNNNLITKNKFDVF